VGHVFGHRHQDQTELNLNETEFGLLVATPILTGSLVRLPLGILTDRYRRTDRLFHADDAWCRHPDLAGRYATQYWQYLVLGLFVGLAGGSFATGIAYTSAWFSKERQGTAMGIFGAGNAGSSLTKFVAPLLVAAFGAWRMVPQVYAVAMMVMAIVFWFFTYTDPLHRKNASSPRQATLGQQLHATAGPAGVALRAGLLLRVRRLRGAGVVAAQILRR
jgi:NNP family nitrate/nitrite transporter-like MFS transporter